MTPKEERAGITRKALEVLHRQPHKTVQEISEVISGFRATRIVDTPMRIVDVLESIADGRVILRETTWGKRVEMYGFSLAYHEARALGVALQELEPPPERTTSAHDKEPA